MRIPRSVANNLKRLKVVREGVDLYHLTRRRIAGTFDRTRLFQHINLQTNNICNRDCYFCEFGIPGRVQKNEIMSQELFDKIIGELVALDYRDRISLFEINEPLTDKRLMRLLKEATTKLPNAWHTLTSNGDLLNQTKMMALFEAGLDVLYLSSYDEKGLNHNLELMNGAPSKLQGRFVHVDMSKVDEDTQLDNRAGLVQLLRRAPPKHGNGRPCERVEKQMIIKPTGIVVSCSSDFFKANPVGDLTKQSLTEVWFGRDFEKLRGELREGRRGTSPLCAKCDYAGYGGFYNNTPDTRPARITPAAPVAVASTAS
jgi:MoaA/NifB/PqqE/SkfB family radical SAM enzyme